MRPGCPYTASGLRHVARQAVRLATDALMQLFRNDGWTLSEARHAAERQPGLRPFGPWILIEHKPTFYAGELATIDLDSGQGAGRSGWSKCCKGKGGQPVEQLPVLFLAGLLSPPF